MTEPGLVPLLERQERLDPTVEGLRTVVNGAFSAAGPAGRVIANGLYGVWLKHPLHPVLTDIPIGAWTVALVLDLLDSRAESRASASPSRTERLARALRVNRSQATASDVGRGADVAVAVGVAGALGAAASGLADWRYEYGPKARVGLVHGLLNASATAAYATSLLLRASGNRTAARSCAMAGFGLVLAGGYLGGDLVYRRALGVDRTFNQEPPEEFTTIIDDAALPEGELHRARVASIPVLLVRQDGVVHALLNRCTHRGGPLNEGTLEDGCVVCPWHGSRFRLADGAVIDGPASIPQPCLETRVYDGKIQVRALRMN